METARLVCKDHGDDERYTLAYTRNPQPAGSLPSLFAGLSG